MQRELARVLRDKLAPLPFVDLLAGLVQTIHTEYVSEEGTKTPNRYPVSLDALGDSCVGKESPMLPDGSRKSLIYFEDWGTAVLPRLHGQTGYNSNIRLVCWLNRANLVGDHYKMVAGRMMASIVDTLAGKNPENVDMFIRLQVEVVRIPPQDAGLFGRYTYREEDRQYLRPPYEFFGIDFSCKYYVPARCFNGINWNLQTCS